MRLGWICRRRSLRRLRCRSWWRRWWTVRQTSTSIYARSCPGASFRPLEWNVEAGRDHSPVFLQLLCNLLLLQRPEVYVAAPGRGDEATSTLVLELVNATLELRPGHSPRDLVVGRPVVTWLDLPHERVVAQVTAICDAGDALGSRDLKVFWVAAGHLRRVFVVSVMPACAPDVF